MFELNRWRSLQGTHVQFRILDNDTIEFNNPLVGMQAVNLELIILAVKVVQSLRDRMKPTDKMLDDILEGMA